MYQKVMVPLDGSALAECVLPHVEAFLQSGVVKTVVFIRVVEPMPLMLYGESVETFPVSGQGEYFADKGEFWDKVEDDRKAAAAEYLDKVTSNLQQYGTQIQKEVLAGRVADTLVNYADNNNVDLALIATHGRSGVSRWIMGSVADRLLHSSRSPVLIVRAESCAPAGKA